MAFRTLRRVVGEGGRDTQPPQRLLSERIKRGGGESESQLSPADGPPQGDAHPCKITAVSNGESRKVLGKESGMTKVAFRELN